ncbi:hypothetical protein SLS58_011069 [Diplodia intermedia]|uniref:GH64 domain-containing protein n=1 Tax=Diplodia intermedia TaxID=856260 RepID=A0ABR3T255_9PEZI
MGSIDDQEILNAARAKFTIHLHNTTKADNVHAYITGTDIQRNARFFLRADGTTPYYPANPPSDGAPLEQDCAIKLGEAGSSTPATIPHLSSARIYFAIGKLHFALNHNDSGTNPDLVEPSSTDATNRNVKWGFAEFTWNAERMYANISFVDFVGLPIALALKSRSGSTSHVSGLAAGGLATVCKKLESVGGDWAKLVITSGGEYVRALSPVQGAVLHPQLLAGYYDGYVSSVWQKYQDATLLVRTGASTTLRGHVENGVLTVGGESFAKPSTAAVFDNASGPFDTNGASQQRKNIIPPLCADFNRSTLLENRETPDPDGRKDYYRNAVTNHYAKIVHATTADGKGYAFPYDDVTPVGGKDQSGLVQSTDPQTLTVTVELLVVMIAGSETTATLLSGLTFYLLRNPATMRKVAEEVGAVGEEDGLSLERSPRLPYLNACVEEGLRMYPPVPIGLLREVSEGGNAVCGEWVLERRGVHFPEDIYLDSS